MERQVPQCSHALRDANGMDPQAVREMGFLSGVCMEPIRLPRSKLSLKFVAIRYKQKGYEAP